MALAAKAELATLFIATREMVTHWQTLIDMVWPQTTKPYPNRQLNSNRSYKKPLFQNNPEWLTWGYGIYDVEAHKISFAITGMQGQKIGLITAPNTIPTYTMKTLPYTC